MQVQVKALGSYVKSHGLHVQGVIGSGEATLLRT